MSGFLIFFSSLLAALVVGFCFGCAVFALRAAWKSGEIAKDEDDVSGAEEGVHPAFLISAFEGQMRGAL
ncbi:hypothetical protein [Rhizobium sp. BK251]|uniref:hypothetical protein n=1 Tax=Rhizobium sp. BK251 TaxID=2512125 RepID=UPI001050433A|nr:hypothetical protein [Rhizobium sp. BK251]TCL70618.1 hypothetical protein EV286_107495 [Rhizobium sp. BK251]